MGFSIEFTDGSKILVPGLQWMYDLTQPATYANGMRLEVYRDYSYIHFQSGEGIDRPALVKEMYGAMKSDSNLFTFADKNDKTPWEDEPREGYSHCEKKVMKLKNGNEWIFYRATPRHNAGTVIPERGPLGGGISETCYEINMNGSYGPPQFTGLRGENKLRYNEENYNKIFPNVIYPEWILSNIRLELFEEPRLIQLVDTVGHEYLALCWIRRDGTQHTEHTTEGPVITTDWNYDVTIIFENDQDKLHPTYVPNMRTIKDSTGDNPFDPSKPGGNTGTGDKKTDPNPKPGLPTGGAIGTIVNAYYITNEQLRDLNDYLWSDDFIENIKKIQNDPMEAVITINSFNIPIDYGTLEPVIMGNTRSTSYAFKLNQQFYTIDCGSIYVPEFFGNALDYSPYTKVEIALPYIGIKPLSIDDIMAKNVGVTYHVDILTGGCIAFITCDDVVMYTYGGTCSTGLPITASDKAEKMKALIQSVSTAGIGLAMGGGMGAVAGAASGAINTLLTKNHVEHGGSIGGDVGIMGIKTPYLILQRPIQSIAASFNSEKGFPSNITATLGSLTGYTEVDSIKLAISTATDNELSEIEQLLREGVIL